MIKIIRFILLSFLIFAPIFYIKWRFVDRNDSLVTLRVMAYPSFVSPYGPSGIIRKEFEKICQCQIYWMSVEDSTSISQRLQLRSDGLKVDVVIGLDQITLDEAYKHSKWTPLNLPQAQFISSFPLWVKKWAIPITWSPLTFITRKIDLNSINSIYYLLDSNLKKSITFPHPKSSTLGLQFYFWIYSLIPEDQRKQFLMNLNKNIYKVTDSWSSSYGMFQKRFVDVTFSYQTSLVYHKINDEIGNQYKNLIFKEGHPYQVEYAAVPQTSKNPNLGEKFIHFLLSKKMQGVLMNKNYMLPVVKGVSNGTLFDSLEKVKLIPYQKLPSFLSEKKQLTKEFNKIINKR